MGHIMHDTMQPSQKTPLEFTEEELLKDFRCSSILVICYFKMGVKMQTMGDGESKSPIC
jgi:hypothetical protein